MYPKKLKFTGLGSQVLRTLFFKTCIRMYDLACLLPFNFEKSRFLGKKRHI